MTALEEPADKSVLVELDHRARDKTDAEYELRLLELIEHVETRQRRLARRQTVKQMEDKQLNEQEGLDFLNSMIAQERDRQGISEPTDG